MNGFFLYSLLLDATEHQSHLELPHHSSQIDCLSNALHLWNKAMEGVGQEERLHTDTTQRDLRSQQTTRDSREDVCARWCLCYLTTGQGLRNNK